MAKSSPPPTSTAWRWCSPVVATSGTDDMHGAAGRRMKAIARGAALPLAVALAACGPSSPQSSATADAPAVAHATTLDDATLVKILLRIYGPGQMAAREAGEDTDDPPLRRTPCASAPAPADPSGRWLLAMC